jgi:hypothetical protein
VSEPVGQSADEPQPPGDLPPPPDQDEWDQAAQEFLLRSLSDIQSSAERWSTALGGLLGLFGTVALVTGPDDIAKVSAGPWRAGAITLIVLAGLSAGVALYLAAVVQLRPSPRSENWNGSAYQVYVISKSRRGARYLNVSRALGVVAAALVFAAGIVVLVDAALA